MVGILVMMNNYFHDFATALVVVCTYGMHFMIRNAEAGGSKDAMRMVLSLYPKMVHLAGGSVAFVIFAGIIRSFTYRQYEWHDAVQTGQVAAIVVKHVVLGLLFVYGLYMWVKVHRKVRAMKEAADGTPGADAPTELDR